MPQNYCKANVEIINNNLFNEYFSKWPWSVLLTYLGQELSREIIYSYLQYHKVKLHTKHELMIMN